MHKLNPSDEWYKKASGEEDKFLDISAGYPEYEFNDEDVADID